MDLLIFFILSLFLCYTSSCCVYVCEFPTWWDGLCVMQRIPIGNWHVYIFTRNEREREKIYLWSPINPQHFQSETCLCLHFRVLQPFLIHANGLPFCQALEFWYYCTLQYIIRLVVIVFVRFRLEKCMKGRIERKTFKSSASTEWKWDELYACVG